MPTSALRIIRGKVASLRPEIRLPYRAKSPPSPRDAVMGEGDRPQAGGGYSSVTMGRIMGFFFVVL